MCYCTHHIYWKDIIKMAYLLSFWTFTKLHCMDTILQAKCRPAICVLNVVQHSVWFRETRWSFMNMSMNQRNVKTGVSRGNLDRLPFELANLYHRTNVSNVQQQILTLHSLYDLYSGIIDLLYQRRNTVKKKMM